MRSEWIRRSWECSGVNWNRNPADGNYWFRGPNGVVIPGIQILKCISWIRIFWDPLWSFSGRSARRVGTSAKLCGGRGALSVTLVESWTEAKHCRLQQWRHPCKSRCCLPMTMKSPPRRKMGWHICFRLWLLWIDHFRKWRFSKALTMKYRVACKRTCRLLLTRSALLLHHHFTEIGPTGAGLE